MVVPSASKASNMAVNTIPLKKQKRDMKVTIDTKKSKETKTIHSSVNNSTIDMNLKSS